MLRRPRALSLLTGVQYAAFVDQVPLEDAMPRAQERNDGTPGTQETYAQKSAKNRFVRNRRKTIDIAEIASYEYAFLRKLCMKRPMDRQWAIRDQMCNFGVGKVLMSPSMESAFMRLYQSKEKGDVRAALRDIVPLLEYRHHETKQMLLKKDDPSKLIPDGEADTLNQKKREMFEHTEIMSNGDKLRLSDPTENNRLRWKIRMKLIRFQRKMAINSAINSRTVLYNESDSLGYFLFRGPPMYAALHRVFAEVTKLLPHFTPKTLLDFGSGTGTSILVAKEVFDPNSLAFPLRRGSRQSFNFSSSGRAWSLNELRYDLQRLQVKNAEVKKARFLAVSALIENGEIALKDIPVDLRKELVDVAKAAAAAATERKRMEHVARKRAEIVTKHEWDLDSTGEGAFNTEDHGDLFPGEFGTNESAADGEGSAAMKDGKKSWWETYVDVESEKLEKKTVKRLQPLQSITAVEPSTAMMETAMTVLHHDVPNVNWRRFLTPEDEAQEHDLVVSAYTLSEIAQPETRMQTVQKLWKMTRGVLVLVEHANLSNYDMLMEARDKILEEKEFGLWDFKPTIVGPCPHEKDCPLRFSARGVKRKKHRVCKTDVFMKPTFIEKWIRQLPLRVQTEPVCYMIFARNEMVPERQERRRVELAAEEARKKKTRDAKQRDLYESSLSITDQVHERLSDEVLHRPDTDLPPPSLSTLTAAEEEAIAAADRLNEPNELEYSRDQLAELTPELKKIPETGDKARRINFGERGEYHRIIIPKPIPPQEHKFNRMPFVSVNHQNSRAQTPGELLVVRSEVDDIRDKFAKKMPKYWRFVNTPISKGGPMRCDFCTTEGDLVKAKVYRRFVGDGVESLKNFSKNIATSSGVRWERVGGWKLAKSAKGGYLWPTDIPIYSVRKYDRVPYPNTLLNTKGSIIDKTGMMHGVPMNPEDTPGATPTMDSDPTGGAFGVMDDGDIKQDELGLSRKQIEKKRLREREDEKGDEFLSNVFDTPIAKKSQLDAMVDSRAEISRSEWAKQIRRSKEKVSKFVSVQNEPFSKVKKKWSKSKYGKVRMPGVHGNVQGKQSANPNKLPKSIRHAQGRAGM